MNYFKSHVRKNRMLKSVMISLFVFCTSFSMYAQSPVKGVVTDEQGEPVFAASVFIEGSQNMVASDLDGKYVIENVDNLSFSWRKVGRKMDILAVEWRINGLFRGWHVNCNNPQ